MHPEYITSQKAMLLYTLRDVFNGLGGLMDDAEWAKLNQDMGEAMLKDAARCRKRHQEKQCSDHAKNNQPASATKTASKSCSCDE